MIFEKVCFYIFILAIGSMLLCNHVLPLRKTHVSTVSTDMYLAHFFAITESCTINRSVDYRVSRHDVSLWDNSKENHLYVKYIIWTKNKQVLPHRRSVSLRQILWVVKSSILLKYNWFLQYSMINFLHSWNYIDDNTKKQIWICIYFVY